MNLDLVVAALRTNCPSFSNRVFGAAEWAAASASTNAEMPCAYVLPQGEDADELYKMSTEYRQSILQRFSVVVCVSSSGQERGQSAFSAFEDLKTEIFKAIAGAETADTDEIVYAGYTNIEMDRAKLVVQLEFSVSYDLVDSQTAHGRTLSELPDFEGMNVTVDPAPADWVDPVKTEINFKTTEG